MPAAPTVKQRINAGEIITVKAVPLDATRDQLEQAAGQCDMFNVDGQHAALNEEKLVAFCAVAEEIDMPVQSRIQHTRHAYLIGRYLDLGATRSSSVPTIWPMTSRAITSRRWKPSMNA